MTIDNWMWMGIGFVQASVFWIMVSIIMLNWQEVNKLKGKKVMDGVEIPKPPPKMTQEYHVFCCNRCHVAIKGSAVVTGSGSHYCSQCWTGEELAKAMIPSPDMKFKKVVNNNYWQALDKVSSDTQGQQDMPSETKNLRLSNVCCAECGSLNYTRGAVLTNAQHVCFACLTEDEKIDAGNSNEVESYFYEHEGKGLDEKA